MKNRLFNVSRKAIIAFLMLLSLGMTSSTLAYWTSYVDGTESESFNTFHIGSAIKGSANLIIHHDYDDEGFVVAAKTLMESQKNSIAYIDIEFELELEDGDADSVWGSMTEAELEIAYDIVLTKNGKDLTTKQYDRVIDYININADEDNVEILRSGEDPEIFVFRITVEDPSKKSHRNLLKKTDINVVFTFTINETTYLTTEIDE